jgi:site-specific recombinase XerD
MATLAFLEDSYLDHHRALGHSSKTVDHYQQSFRLFRRFVEETNRAADASALTTPVMQAFVAWLRETPSRGFRGATARTVDGIHGVMKDLRAFTRYLVAEEMLEKQPKVPVPKLPQHLFPVLTEEELQRIFTCKQLDAKTEIGKRNRAMVAFMLDTGVRLSEVASLQLSAVNIRDGSARVTGKGNKERIVYFSDSALTAMKLWLALRGNDDGSLFWLQRAGVRQVLERIKKETGISMLFPHQLRHTALTLLVKGDMDLHSIKRMAGHASVTTTERYLALSQEDIRAKQNAASPFDRIQQSIEPEKSAKRRLKAS